MKHAFYGAVLWGTIASMVVPSAVGLFPRVARAAEKTSTGFYYPTKTDPSQWDSTYAKWLSDSCGVNGASIYNHGGYGADNAGLYHIGRDISQGYDKPVYAIADGEVIDHQIKGFNVRLDVAYGLLIKHHLADGRIFFALYAHVISPLQHGQKVVAGQEVAKVGIKTDPHVHLGITMDWDSVIDKKSLGAMPCSAWGTQNQDNNFTDPIEFIQTHTPKNANPLPFPIGSLIRVKNGDGKVYLVSVDSLGNIVKRWVREEVTFTLNGFSWSDVLIYQFTIHM